MPDEHAREDELLHQFKNHLTVIIGYSQVLIEELTDDNARNDIAEIRQEASAALALIPALAARLR